MRTTAWWTRAEQENLSLIRATFEDVPSDARAQTPVELPTSVYDVPPAKSFSPVYTPADTEANQLVASRPRLRIDG